MYCVRVQEEIGHRLDAEFYNPAALATEAKMRANGIVQPLGKQITEGYRVVYHGTDSISGTTTEDLIPFLSPTQIDDRGGIDFSSIDQLPGYYKDRYPKGLAIAGELLVEVKGNVRKVAVVPDIFPKNLMVSGSLYKATLAPDLDSRYILAFLQSRPGQILKNRLTSNTIIQYIAKFDLYSIQIFLADKAVQCYIGNKVRQAERLSAWAKGLEVGFTAKLQAEMPEAFTDRRTGRKHSTAAKQDISYTLNPGAFDEERLRVQKYLKSCGGRELSSMANIKAAATPSYATQARYVGLNAISSNSCQLRPESVSSAGVTGACRVLLEGPVVAKLRPYLNKVGYIPSWLAGSFGSTELLCVQPKGHLSGWYLYGVLKSEAALKQLRPLASGATHPRIDSHDLYHIVVPVLAHANELGEMLAQAQVGYFYSGFLTTAAKLLVESLIEAQITESQLIAAQQALEAGDDSLDRAILARLKTDGLDGTGAPLFLDLDQLYDLLERAKAEAEA